MTAAEVIAALDLQPHPEGGGFRETYRHDPGAGRRGAMTAIYYLLRPGENSAWHRLRDADEIWHHYAGAPLELSLCVEGGEVEQLPLGPEIANGQRPQAVVPADCWQATMCLGEWSLVGCTVGPAFRFEAFERAPAGCRPDGQP